MPSRKRPYAVLIEDHSEDEYEDYDGSSVIFIDDEDVDILIDTDTDDPGGHDYGHFTPMLCEFFRVLHEAGIRAVEWGAGLAESMGAPVVVIDNMIIVPSHRLEDALQLASAVFPASAPDPDYNPYGIVGELAHWFTVPDHSHENASLLILDARDVQLNLNRAKFVPEYNIYRPGPTEAFRSFVHFACMHVDPEDYHATGAVTMWISEFVLYTVCGVKYIPKCDVEDDVYEDPAWEEEGLARVPTLEWTDETRWLEGTLRQLVKGELSYDEFTPEWWEDHVEDDRVRRRGART